VTNAVTDASSSQLPSQQPLPSNYQEVGQALVAQAAASCGILATHNNDTIPSSQSSLPPTLSLEWKADTLIVTVWADNVYVSNPVSQEDDDDSQLDIDDSDANVGSDPAMPELADDSVDTMDYYDDDDVVENDSLSSNLDDTDVNEDDSSASTATDTTNEDKGIDMVLLTRVIVAALDNDPVGAMIAARFGLQVTTPGASDLLSTPAMFRAYAGFEVIVSHQDAKTKGLKTIVGRLVERNDMFLVLNIKGRVKKLKVSDVVSVRLPKAKKEKGVS
jgi:ribosome maturation factor RimP